MPAAAQRLGKESCQEELPERWGSTEVHGGPCVLRGCSLLCLLCPDYRVAFLAFWNVLLLAKSIDLGCTSQPTGHPEAC